MNEMDTIDQIGIINVTESKQKKICIKNFAIVSLFLLTTAIYKHRPFLIQCSFGVDPLNNGICKRNEHQAHNGLYQTYRR